MSSVRFVDLYTDSDDPTVYISTITRIPNATDIVAETIFVLHAVCRELKIAQRGCDVIENIQYALVSDHLCHTKCSGYILQEGNIRNMRISQQKGEF
jgi:hypothetical protein